MNYFENKFNENLIQLPQNFFMAFLSWGLWDKIIKQDEKNNDSDRKDDKFHEFVKFDSYVNRFIQQNINKGLLAYIETDYFGGFGDQSAIVFEAGEIVFKSINVEDSINKALYRLGVIADNEKDEFDSMHLSEYRHIPNDDY